MVLARVQHAAGQHHEAARTTRTLVARREKRAGADHLSLVEPLELRAEVLKALGNEKESDELSKRAMKIRETHEKKPSDD